MKQTDEDLLMEIAKGDTAAFSEFYDRYSHLVFGGLMRIIKDKAEAEDILQEVFLQVWRKADTYKPELGIARNWLVRIAHNRAINLVRSAQHRSKKGKVDIPEDDALSIIREIELIDNTYVENSMNYDRKEMITLAFETLPKEKMILLDLAFLKGYSHSEISQKLEMPLGTVKTNIRRSLLALRKSLFYVESEFS
jgi:RNA polymerase sigma-70 factor (ECF subfamily)